MKKYIKSKKFILIATLALSLLTVSFILLSLNNKRTKNISIPKDISSQISDFQIYFPKNTSALPDNLKIDKESIVYQNNVLFFTIISPKDNTKIVISQQPVPKEFSAQGGSFVGKDTIDTKNGKATISYVENRTSVFMVTNDHQTLVILNSNQAIQTDIIRSILSNLDGI